MANEIQTITFSNTNATGGTWTLTYDGQTTAGIAHNANAADVQTALEALSNIGVGNVAVSGSIAGGFPVMFQGALAGTNVAEMTANGGGLTKQGTMTAVATTEGVDAVAAIAEVFRVLNGGTSTGTYEFSDGVGGNGTAVFTSGIYDGGSAPAGYSVSAGGSVGVDNYVTYTADAAGVKPNMAETVGLMDTTLSILTEGAEEVVAVAEIQNLSAGSDVMQSGVWCPGGVTAVNWNATDAAVDTAIETDISPLTVSVVRSGSEGSYYYDITWETAGARSLLPISNTGLVASWSGNITVTTTQQGSAGSSIGPVAMHHYANLRR